MAGAIHYLNNDAYCSRECAILAATDEIIMNAKEQAIELYASEAYVTEIVDTCNHCGKDLSTCETIQAMGGSLYCTEECAIASLQVYYQKYDIAKDIFDETAEEINPRDIGIGGAQDE
jgi:hypothetical protein